MINLINLVAVEYRMVVQFPTVSCFSFFHVCVFSSTYRSGLVAIGMHTILVTFRRSHRWCRRTSRPLDV